MMKALQSKLQGGGGGVSENKNLKIMNYELYFCKSNFTDVELNKRLFHNLLWKAYKLLNLFLKTNNKRFKKILINH